MCGLIGFVSKFRSGIVNDDAKIFSQLLYADALRGEDSTGVYVVDRDGNVDVEKEATTATYYMNTKEYSNLMSNAVKYGVFMVGHNRAATRGKVTDENAHPFVVDDNIVLVHNGSLTTDHTKLVDVEVDSHAIAQLISNANGNIEEAIQQVIGAYALIWYNVEEKTLNFVRNSQRPLWYVETSRGIWWASEPQMLEWILKRNSVMLTSAFTELPVGEHQKFTLTDQCINVSKTKVELTKPYTYVNYTNPSKDYTDEEAEYYSRYGNGCPFLENERDPVGNVTVTPAKQTVIPFKVRVNEGESALAYKAGFFMDVPRFNEVSQKYPDGSWVSGRPFDYDYVKGSTGQSGIFLYCRMENEPDMMIRCYVPYDGSADVQTFENEMLEIALGGRKHMFQLITRGWHVHDNNKNDGWGCLYSIEYAPIKVGLEETA